MKFRLCADRSAQRRRAVFTACALLAVSGSAAVPAHAQSPDDVVGTAEDILLADREPSLDADLQQTPGLGQEIYVVDPVTEPDPAIDGVDAVPTAAELAVPSPEILQLRDESVQQSTAAALPEVCVSDHDGIHETCLVAPARAGYRCAVNSFSPRKIGRNTVQGRAINICAGDIARQDVSTCVAFFGRDRIWHASVCGNKAKNGAGTIDHRPAGPCVPGLRFWRTEAFGHVVITSGKSFTSRVDTSKQVGIRC